MLNTILRWVVNAVLLMLIPYIVPGIEIKNFGTALVAALVLAFVNALIKPILILLTLPINLLTLGLFILVINALMFWLVSAIVKGFYISGFWPALFAALVFSIFSLVLNYFLD
ncbi:MAG: phage holin family protein [Deltaproteobacteria bacterium]|nr:phage holin family protein [Deltaproteobacteria bacterium]